MKLLQHLLAIGSLIATVSVSQAQTPQLINYQAVARNATGGILANSPNVSVRFTVHDGGTGGTIEYQETHSTSTNQYGLFTLHVGDGTVVSGSMSGVSWGSGNKYLQVEIDPSGGTAWVDMGAQQLVSVPYALYAANGGGVSTYTPGTGINITGTTISAQNTTALWNADELQGNGISTSVPTTGQVLSFDGTNWGPATLTSGGGGTVTSVTTGAGLSGGTITTSGTISMPDVITAGTYGSATQIPVFTTDSKGRVIGVTPTTIATGGTGTVTSVNTTAGQLTGGPITSSGTLGLATSGVTAGTYGSTTQVPQIAIDNFGRVTSATNVAIASGGTGWSLTGNSGTTPGTNFIGTTDAQNLVFKVNNQRSGLIDQTNSNTMFGYQAGLSNTGLQNSFFGMGSGYSNTTGNQNTATGQASLYYNTTGNYNTAFGRSSLANNTIANYNTALGYLSMQLNTTGASNTAVGSQSLNFNSTGNYNTGIGVSLVSNTTGNNNTALGYGTLVNNNNSDNTAVGYNSQNNNLGSQNTSVGSGSLQTGGAYNAAIGFQSLTNNTGSYNTATGWWSMLQNTSGQSNTAFGEEALYNNTTGNGSTAVGTSALYHNTGSNGSTAIGANALFYSTGAFNTAVGNTALYTNTTGTNNTAIGNGADVSSGSLTNATAIGYATSVNLSNKVRIGNGLVSVIEGQVSYSYPSDGRFKTNISEDIKGLEFINKLRPVSYNFEAKKFDAFLMKTKPDSVRNRILAGNDYREAESMRHSGFIAQEVEQVVKETGYNFSGLHVPANDNDNYSIAYSEFTVPLVKAVQELNAKNEALQKSNETQNQKIDLLQKQVTDLMEEVKEMKKTK